MIRIALIAGLLAGGACAESGAGSSDGAKGDVAVVKPTPKIVVVSPLNKFDCEQCHRHVDEAAWGSVKSHAEIQVKHMPDARCKSCHDPAQPSRLRLASGQAIELKNAHLLCGQCHSTQAADWSVGIHGKQIGNWQTELHRYACTRCHDAHAPAFGTMQAVDRSQA
jgi:Zn finger protein HypA/HybF involved in hydrogenase expression